jgi:hypothetical protein
MPAQSAKRVVLALDVAGIHVVDSAWKKGVDDRA